VGGLILEGTCRVCERPVSLFDSDVHDYLKEPDEGITHAVTCRQPNEQKIRRALRVMEMWWETRREGERTSDYLARVLGELGPPFAQLANNAEARHYDDFFCPPEVDDGMNINRLVADLLAVTQAQNDPALRKRATAVGRAAKDGEFDGTREESREWALSPQGQAAFQLLLPKRKGTNGAG